jgi:hypothetical protein
MGFNSAFKGLITRCRRQFLRKAWPLQLAFRLLISCRIFLCSLTLSNTFSFFTCSVQLIFSILLQHHISKLSRYFWSTVRIVQVSAPYKAMRRYKVKQSMIYMWLVLLHTTSHIVLSFWLYITHISTVARKHWLILLSRCVFIINVILLLIYKRKSDVSKVIFNSWNLRKIGRGEMSEHGEWSAMTNILPKNHFVKTVEIRCISRTQNSHFRFKFLFF